jgi:hypothetical protein
MRHGSVDELQTASDSVDVITGLIRTFPAIDFVTLAELTVPTAAKNKVIAHNSALKTLNDEALDLRRKYYIPFWMAIASVAQSHGMSLPSELLRAAAFHQPMTGVDVEHVPASSITADYLRARSVGLHPGRILTFSSHVILRNQAVAHIPMLDFRISASRTNLTTALATLSELGHDGIILDSGQSYHFYGLTLLSSEELRTFLGKALLFTPVIDYRWIAHQLIEGACALRLSPGANNQKTPTAVATVTRQFGAALR